MPIFHISSLKKRYRYKLLFKISSNGQSSEKTENSTVFKLNKFERHDLEKNVFKIYDLKIICNFMYIKILIFFK
jgi:hypothetical protein